MPVKVTRKNIDKPALMGQISDLPLGGGFIWDGGKLYIRSGADRTFCPEIGAENVIADFGGVAVPLRDVAYEDDAASA